MESSACDHYLLKTFLCGFPIRLLFFTHLLSQGLEWSIKGSVLAQPR